jgi:hypothetical protein
MKTIPLTKGYVALVSDEDFERVNAYKWCAKVDPHTVYAIRSLRLEDGKRTTIKMHRFIAGVTNPQIDVDHKDHNGLNNQRENLRVCTRAQNHGNRKKTRGTATFKGVTWDREKWLAGIRINRKRQYLGRFTDEIDAAMAYDDAARQLFGPFALTNFPEVVVT